MVCHRSRASWITIERCRKIYINASKELSLILVTLALGNKSKFIRQEKLPVHLKTAPYKKTRKKKTRKAIAKLSMLHVNAATFMSSSFTEKGSK